MNGIFGTTSACMTAAARSARQSACWRIRTSCISARTTGWYSPLTPTGVNDDSGELSAEAYTDDGRPIFWCWTTPFDALGQPNRVKRDNKRGGVLELKSMSHGQVKGKVRTNRAPWKEFVRVDGGYFDFTDLNFADLSFATEEKSLVSFQSKQKRWVKKQLMFYGDEAGRPGGLYAITMEAFLAGYYR